MQDRRGQADALPVALGQLADRSRQHVADGALLDGPGQAVSGRGGVEVPHLRGELQVLLNQHVVVQGGVFGEVADHALNLERMFHDVVAGHGRAARGRQEVADEDLHRRGLAGAVGTQQADDLSLADIRGDAA